MTFKQYLQLYVYWQVSCFHCIFWSQSVYKIEHLVDQKNDNNGNLQTRIAICSNSHKVTTDKDKNDGFSINL